MFRRSASNQQKYMTAGEAARFTGLATERTFLRWAKGNKLRHLVLPNGRIRFYRSDIEALLTPQGDDAKNVNAIENEPLPGLEGVA